MVNEVAIKTKKVSGKRSGFQRFKPFISHFGYQNEPVKVKKTLTDHLKEFVENSGPYYLFITLTFGRNGIGINKQFQFTNFLLHLLNQIYFRRNYQDRNKFLDGFAFFEDHLSPKLEGRFHIHLLIKRDVRLREFGFKRNKDIFHTVISKVLDDSGRQVFRSKCTDFSRVTKDKGGSKGAINYCMKQISERNIDRIKMLGVKGLSDSDSDFN